MGNADLRRSGVTLESAAHLLPVLARLLRSGYDEHASVGLKAASFLFHAFSGVVRDTIAKGGGGKGGKGGGGPVDVSGEERLERCHVCHEAFAELAPAVAALGKRAPPVGPKARQLAKLLGPFVDSC